MCCSSWRKKGKKIGWPTNSPVRSPSPHTVRDTLAECFRVLEKLERRLGNRLFKDFLALHFSTSRPPAEELQNHPVIVAVVEELARARDRGEIPADVDVMHNGGVIPRRALRPADHDSRVPQDTSARHRRIPDNVHVRAAGYCALSLARAFAVLATRPAAGSTHTLFQLFLGAADATLARLLLLGVFDPADELVAGQGSDVLPRRQRRVVVEQRRSQVGRKFVHHPPTGYRFRAHSNRLASPEPERVTRGGRSRYRMQDLFFSMGVDNPPRRRFARATVKAMRGGGTAR